jgi:hypothetical protein
MRELSESDGKRILNYLIKKDYLELWLFLIMSWDALSNRRKFLVQDVDGLKKNLRKLCHKIGENPDAAVPENLEMSQLFNDLHYLELEVIQNINILTELLAVYYHFIRRNPRALPKAIGASDITSRELRAEFDFFSRQEIDDIFQNFKYPNSADFKELKSEDQTKLKDILTKSAKITLERFRKISQFRQNFITVYNKYKHTLSEITGNFGINKEKRLVQSYIFVRQKEKTTGTGKPQCFAYVIPVTFDTFEYFDDIARNVCTLLQMLFDNTLLFLANEEKDFIPRAIFIADKNLREDFQKICAKVTTYIMPTIRGMSMLKAPTPEIAEKMSNCLKAMHIYRMSKDILDLESIMKEGVAIFGTNEQNPDNRRI